MAVAGGVKGLTLCVGREGGGLPPAAQQALALKAGLTLHVPIPKSSFIFNSIHWRCQQGKQGYVAAATIFYLSI